MLKVLSVPPLSLYDPENFRLPNICFSISSLIAFFRFEVQNHYSKHSLLSLAEDDVQDEGFGHFGKLLISSGSLPWIHVIKLFLKFAPINLPHVNLI